MGLRRHDSLSASSQIPSRHGQQLGPPSAMGERRSAQGVPAPKRDRETETQRDKLSMEDLKG